MTGGHFENHDPISDLTEVELAERRMKAEEFWQRPETIQEVERIRQMAALGIRSEAVNPEELRRRFGIE